MPEFVRVASTSDVPSGEMIIVEAGDKEVVIANIDGKLVCFSNECTHKQGPMGEGMLLDDGIVECPFHGAQFNTSTGEVIAPPAEDPLPTYEVKVDGDDVSVAVG